MASNKCEYCAYYVYNETYECYECMVNLDEDDLERFLRSSADDCNYFKSGDDYEIVRKQN